MKKIPLTGKHGQGKFALIDDEDYNLFNNHALFLTGSGETKHIVFKKQGKHISIHRLIMRIADNTKVVDHINRNTLDNRKNNLRICTRAQNLWNRGPSLNSTSGYKGISFDRNRNKYRVKIVCNSKEYFIGRFNNLKDAKQAYNNNVKEYHKEFSNYIIME